MVNIRLSKEISPIAISICKVFKISLPIMLSKIPKDTAYVVLCKDPTGILGYLYQTLLLVESLESSRSLVLLQKLCNL